MANDDFDLLHNFAHDLKTPLGAVKSYIELMEASGDLNDQQQHFAHRAFAGIDRMQRIISALLDFARMESEIELDIEVCDLLDIIEETTAILESAAQEKRIKFSIHVPSDAQFVEADSHLLSHVISNLLSNAIKYNRLDGQVQVTAKETEEFIQVEIRDTGLGIPKDQQAKVFKRFFRVEQKEHQLIEGTGLGLAIVKGVIDRHGGSISLKSKSGKGSTFIFTLPRANTSSPDRDREIPDDLDDHLQEGREQTDDSDSGDY